MSAVLTATFVRRRGERLRVYVTRGDGSTTGWSFPGYGDGLPHDLCHLVVEDELGMADGFWGLVDRGMDVTLVNNQSTLMMDGRRLGEIDGLDLSGLRAAEGAVAVLTGHGLGGGGDGRDWEQRQADEIAAMGPAVTRIRDRLVAYATTWAELPDGGSLRASFEVRQPAE